VWLDRIHIPSKKKIQKSDNYIVTCVSLLVNDPISMVAKPGAGYGMQSLLVDGKVISMVYLVERRDHNLSDA